MNVIASWSGGKDSCLAWHKAAQQGHNVKFLLNFISEEYKRCCFHGITGELMRMQADAVGIPIVQKEAPSDMKEYEAAFKEAVSELRDKHGIEGMVFGDVYLEEHENWVKRVCKDLGIIPIEPLWNMPAKDVVGEFVDKGFRSKVVSAKADLFDRDFLGRDIDRSMINKLIERNICPCGENGEFHTFVYDGPVFKKRIELTKQDKILKQGFWKHWFLDIQEYKVVPK